MTEVNLGECSVMLAMPVHRGVPAPTVMSLIQTVRACAASGIPLEVPMSNGSSVVSAARNRLADHFLKSQHTHLFWVDSDMEWAIDSFFKILAMATVKPVARATYPKRREPISFDSDGLGFCCVARSAMEAIAAKAPLIWYGELEPCRAIFQEGMAKTESATKAGADFEFIAEDLNFFSELTSLGFDIWLDPEITLGHVGEKTYTGRLSDYVE